MFVCDIEPDAVYWTEGRPEEGGRIVVCCYSEGDEDVHSLTPKQYNCRTTVHEYGGGAHFVYNRHIYFSNFDDQRLYRQKAKGKGGHYVEKEPQPITPAGKDWRWVNGHCIHTFCYIMHYREVADNR